MAGQTTSKSKESGTERRDASTKLAANRLSVLELAKELDPRLYLDNCNACHFATRRGVDEMFPELDGLSLVTAESPTVLISMILHGGVLPSTAERPARLRMPGFGVRLSNELVATLASFLRQAWTNKANPVATAVFSDLRKVAQAK